MPERKSYYRNRSRTTKNIINRPAGIAEASLPSRASLRIYDRNTKRFQWLWENR